MSILKLVSFTVALLGLTASDSASQQIGGPARGHLPAGERRMNRVAPFLKLETTAVPMTAEPRKKLRREPLFSLREQPPAAAPAGTNYVLDAAAKGLAPDLPPITLASFGGIPRTDSYPPDPVIAAGPRHLVAAVNREIRIFTKRGTLLEKINASAWFNPVVPGCKPFDPRVLYDHFTGRFLMLWHHYSSRPDVSFYLLSLSASDDPTGQWVSWALPADVNGSSPSGTWADNGCLGLDSSAVYIVSNQYTFKPMEPFDVRVRIIPKSGLYSDREADITWTDFSIRDAFCVRPAVVHGQADAYFLLEAPYPLPIATTVILYRIENPVSNPVLTARQVPVTEYQRAMDAGQPGGDLPLDTRRSYLHSEVQLFNGSLHAAHSIANPMSPDYSSIRYLRINTATNTATEDITFGAPGYWYFYPAAAVDQDENVVITFARSGLSEFPGTFFTWRLAVDPPTLRPSVVIQPGWAPYQELDSYNANRWGDYSAAVLDPVDRRSFWLMGEYADGPSIWGTWVKSVRLVPFAMPKLVVDRTTVDFGYVDIEGGAASAHVIVRNGGSQSLTISSVLPSSPLFTVVNPPSWPVTLALYDSLTLKIAFSPSDTGSIHEELVVTSNDPTDPMAAIALDGAGVRVAGTVPEVIYAVQTGRSGDLLHFLDAGGGIQASVPLGISGLRTLSVGLWDNRNYPLYGAARANHGTMIVHIDGSNGRLYSQHTIALYGVGAINAHARDTLYCGTDAGFVYRFTPSTSELNLIAKREGIGFSGFAVSSALDRLWATASSPATNDTLYSIDLRTGTIIPVGRTGFFVATNSICRAPDGGLLAVVANSLVRIDTLTGEGTFVAHVALEGLCAIAAGARITTAVETSLMQPHAFALGQNYPNPFNPTTVFNYQLPVFIDVRLAIYDLLGREVATLVNERRPPGRHEVRFDASGLSSGIYLYRMQAGSFVDVKKFVVLK